MVRHGQHKTKPQARSAGYRLPAQTWFIAAGTSHLPNVATAEGRYINKCIDTCVSTSVCVYDVYRHGSRHVYSTCALGSCHRPRRIVFWQRQRELFFCLFEDVVLGRTRTGGRSTHSSCLRRLTRRSSAGYKLRRPSLAVGRWHRLVTPNRRALAVG